MTQVPAPGNRTPPLFIGIFVVSCLVALIPTVWADLDLRAAALFAGPAATLEAVQWPWVVWINAYVPAAFRIGIALALIAWVWATWGKGFQQWRLPLAFLVLAGILGPGAIVNLGFKDNWQRARPYQVENFGGTQKFTRATVMTDQCESNCSFVSGHVACGFFFTTILLVHRKRKVAWAVGGTLAGLTIGFSRMADVAHWMSDVLWAYPITLASSWLVWKALVWAYERPSRTVG